MKRSEMIEWLTNRIDEENGESFKINTADLDNLGAIAGFALTMLEEKGMGPPLWKDEVGPFTLNGADIGLRLTWEDE